MNNKILTDMSYGVYVIGCKDRDRNVGCIANSVMQITSDPVAIAISVNNDNYTNKCIRENNRFSISILNEESNPQIIGTFGFSSSDEVDKYKDFDYEIIEQMPVIKDSNGYIVCEVKSILEAGTHTVFIGEAVVMDKFEDKKPMTYSFYHEVLKGKSPKKAPTYIEEIILDEIKTNRWKCKVCGYIYEGEELPLDFRCPICKQKRDFFEKID